MEETLSPVGGVVYFGDGGEVGTVDCRQWLKSTINNTDPLVKAEEALAVTKILDNIYRSAAQNILSVIDQFAVKVDDSEVPVEHIKFCINGKEFSPVEMLNGVLAIGPTTERCQCYGWHFIG